MAEKNSIDNISNPLSSTEVTVDPGIAATDSYITFNVTRTACYNSIGNDVTASDSFLLSQDTVLGVNDRLEITSAGACLKPYQPAFLAYLASTASNVTGQGIPLFYRLGNVFPLTEIYDQHNNFNTNGIFTVPKTGLYHLYASVYLGDITFRINGIEKAIWINTAGRIYYGSYGGDCADPNNRDHLQVEALVLLTAGNTAECDIRVSGYVSNQVDILGQATHPLTYFGGYLVC